jgi:hypothetical protein
MRTRTKDRLINLLLILFFVGIMAGSGYYIVRIMMHWSIKGLG